MLLNNYFKFIITACKSYVAYDVCMTYGPKPNCICLCMNLGICMVSLHM